MIRDHDVWAVPVLLEAASGVWSEGRGLAVSQPGHYLHVAEILAEPERPVARLQVNGAWTPTGPALARATDTPGRRYACRLPSLPAPWRHAEVLPDAGGGGVHLLVAAELRDVRSDTVPAEPWRDTTAWIYWARALISAWATEAPCDLHRDLVRAALPSVDAEDATLVEGVAGELCRVAVELVAALAPAKRGAEVRGTCTQVLRAHGMKLSRRLKNCEPVLRLSKGGTGGGGRPRALEWPAVLVAAARALAPGIRTQLSLTPCLLAHVSRTLMAAPVATVVTADGGLEWAAGRIVAVPAARLDMVPAAAMDIARAAMDRGCAAAVSVVVPYLVTTTAGTIRSGNAWPAVVLPAGRNSIRALWGVDLKVDEIEAALDWLSGLRWAGLPAVEGWTLRHLPPGEKGGRRAMVFEVRVGAPLAPLALHRTYKQ